jgi:hypothetical protein
VRTGREFTDILTVYVLEPGKLPAQPDGSRLFNWGQFFKARSREELNMVRNTDPMINKAAGLVVELNEDEAERMRADNRLYFLMDQNGLRREREAKGLEQGREETEVKYRPILEAKDREIEALRRKLREAGIDS